MTDIYSKYAWLVPLNDKKRIAVTNAFKKVLKEYGCKPNKILANKDSKFYNRLIKSLLEDNDVKLYQTNKKR